MKPNPLDTPPEDGEVLVFGFDGKAKPSNVKPTKPFIKPEARMIREDDGFNPMAVVAITTMIFLSGIVTYIIAASTMQNSPYKICVGEHGRCYNVSEYEVLEGGVEFEQDNYCVTITGHYTVIENKGTK